MKQKGAEEISESFTSIDVRRLGAIGQRSWRHERYRPDAHGRACVEHERSNAIGCRIRRRIDVRNELKEFNWNEF